MTDRPLRIGIVAPYDLSEPGGVNNQIRGQARALRHLGHDVGVYGPASSPLGGGEQSLGRSVSVTLSGTRAGLGVDPHGPAAVGRMLRERFDVVHVHEPLTPLVPWIVVWKARCPVVGTFHVHRENGHRLYALSAWALAPLVGKLGARLAVSDAARRTVTRHFPGEYEIVPNGIEAAAFRAPRLRPATMASHRPYVLCVGRLEARKGVDHLIRAMPQVQHHVADVTLVVVGDGPDRERLMALASQVHATVQFLGRVPDEALPAYFQAADVVCAPALGGESFGIVLLEAMACAKPLVASRIEGYAALVGGAECARLVTPGDVGGLSNELVWLFECEDRRRSLGERGAAFVRDYDWNTIARRLETVYRRLCSFSIAPGTTGSRRDCAR
jgi:phosphatidylinositol alpha-mannosyltransferase